MSIRFTNKPEEANAITHAGNFHADDIFSIILLEKILGNVIIFRTQSEICDRKRFQPNAIIFDVGFGRYDHHQKNGNGFHFSKNTTKKPIPYASLGILWKEFGLGICNKIANNDGNLSKKLWNNMEQLLIIGIDSIDNGIYPIFPGEYSSNRVMTVSSIISLLNPIDSEENELLLLEKAISIARFIFDVCMNMLLYKEKNPKYSITQNPKYFLAEQVFTCALLKRIYPNFDFDVENLEASLKLVGLKTHDFDNDYSLFRNIWESVGQEYCSNFSHDSNYPNYIWEYTKNSLIIGIDALSRGFIPHNNTNFIDYKIFAISDFINTLNPFLYSVESYKESFKIALYFAELLLDRVIKEATERLSSRNYVEQEILKSTLPVQDEFSQSSKHILIFEKHVHWKEWVARSKLAKDIWFVISPSNKGGYVVQPVPCKYHMNGWRKGFPKKWYGLNGKNLQRITKVPTAIFVHPANGFIAGASDLKGAVQLAKRAFSNNECARILTT